MQLITDADKTELQRYCSVQALLLRLIFAFYSTVKLIYKDTVVFKLYF